DGAFQQIAQVTEVTYHDSGLQNDSPVFYRVRTVGAQGEDGVDSNTVSVTPTAHPGPTTVRVILPSEDRAATLAWEAPALAGSYRIFRAFAADAAFQQIAQVMDLTYHDSGLQNDSPVFYRVRTVGAQGEDGVDSNTVGVTPHARRPGVAYLNPTNQPGNYVLTGYSVGMDFDVVKPVRVTRLGVFDENSDGLKTPLH